MPNGNGSRRAHVKRVFATESDTVLNTEVWIDVLRLDQLPVAFQSSADSGAVGQEIDYVLHWNDDPNHPKDQIDNSKADQQGENANAARETSQLAIENPESPDDPQVLLWIIERALVSRQADPDTGKLGQDVQLVFDNAVVADREVSVIKVVNNDLGGMQMADQDGRNPAIVDWNDYQQALQAGQTDDSQRLDVECTDRYSGAFQAAETTGAAGQYITFVLANGQVEQLFDAGDPKAVDVIRTDPLQVIVNVGFGGLAVIFGPMAEDAPPFRAAVQLKIARAPA
jgi:hypothetical protein